MAKSRLLLTSFIAVSFSFLLVGITSISTKAEVRALEIAQANSKGISEADVNRIMDEIAAGTKKLDVDSLLVKYAVPFLISEFTSATTDASVSMVIEGRDNLRDTMKQSYGKLKEIQELVRDREVVISAKGQIAVAEDDSVLELTGKDGKKHIVTSSTKTRFAIVNGELKIISFESRSHTAETLSRTTSQSLAK
ncbi:hypothetical protein H6G76_27095 [Nostoc sp. FACHB-152]|uniref:hypothetical protein n=1 Tax=unclassified Nostoc TaxID=2593658 RepID=UPI0016885367|nr:MULTISPECIES: hypothetical protein [unclassified Nostoc]MBD2450728.1 hypothetical protein [Nostoc sp. FACHB-152]MBD2471940.1 hypothetical protein [Nostoc sp. FACHB-145]